jgi:hypothetical protein
MKRRIKEAVKQLQIASFVLLRSKGRAPDGGVFQQAVK